MRNTFVIAIVSIYASGCGGGGESGGYEGIPITLPTYGAIAVNQSNGRAGITAKETLIYSPPPLPST
jgi:hypothetical protein